MGYAGSQYHRGPGFCDDPLAESSMKTEDLRRVRGGNAVFGEKTGASYQVELIDDLKAVDVSLMTNGMAVLVLGYESVDDGCGGIFVYQSNSSAADNGGTVIAPDAGSGRWVRAFNGAINVHWFGAREGSDADNYAAIMAAYDVIPDEGGALYFPAGSYQFLTALSFLDAKPLMLVGDGQFASILVPTFPGGNAVTVNGTASFGMSALGLVPSVGRVSGTYNLYVKTATRAMLSSVYMNNSTGGLLMFETVNFLELVNCEGDSGVGGIGDTCLRIKGAGGEISNCIFRTATPNAGVGNSPTLWISGGTTSLKFTNCNFSGGGPRSRFNILGIASTGANFTVTVAAHTFNAGDFLVLRGASVSTYNNSWLIASVTSTTITVTTALNPGTATASGTAESMAACGYVSNEDGYVNESQMDTVLFESATGQRTYGSASLLVDGRRGTVGARYPIQGWMLSNIYLDFGADGLVFNASEATTGTGDTTIFGWVCSTITGQSTTRNALIWQAKNIIINGLSTSRSVAAETFDYITSPVSAGVYIYTGLAAPYCRGINIVNSNIGQPRDYLDASYGFNGYNFRYGVVIDGAGLQDLVLSDNNLYGYSLPILPLNSAVASGQRWKIRDNGLSSGATPILASTVITSAASASNVDFDLGYETIKITGTTPVSSFSSGWIGREVDLLFVAAVTLQTGGNLALGANYNVLAGQLVRVAFDGTSWFVK